jgi:hypothetical protein
MRNDHGRLPMSETLRQLVKETIKLELNVAKLYLSFHNRFPEDADFWWRIAIEEKHHAALLRSGEQYFLDAGEFPSELVATSLTAIINFNSELESMLKQKGEAPQSREFAFNFALQLEESAGEIQFQHAMQETEYSSEALKLFQRLNEGDIDHADRIRSYMHQNGIGMTSIL